jgi:Oxygenase domain of the 2OGFeDO superfamily
LEARVKTIFLKHDYREAVRQLEGEFAAPSHVEEPLHEDAKVYTPDGSIAAVLLCKAIPSALHKLAFALWKTVRELPSNRGTATGSSSLPRVKSDGSLSERRAVHKKVLQILKQQGAAQGTLGNLDATADQPCHKTPLSVRHPEMLDGNKPLIELVDALYRQHASTFYAKQRSVIEQAPRWRLWLTVFSTIYVAKNFRTAYHFDSGNLPGVMSALMPMGKFTGGELVIPRWRIAIAYRPGDLLFFDPQQLHGNLPFEGERLSAVFYCERRIAECGK